MSIYPHVQILNDVFRLFSQHISVAVQHCIMRCIYYIRPIVFVHGADAQQRETSAHQNQLVTKTKSKIDKNMLLMNRNRIVALSFLSYYFTGELR